MAKGTSFNKFPGLAQLTVKYASDIILWVQSDGLIIYGNDALYEQLDLNEEQLSAPKLVDLIQGLEEADWPKKWAAIKKNAQEEQEYTITQGDGQLVTVRATERFFEHEGQEIICIFWRPFVGEQPTSAVIGTAKGVYLMDDIHVRSHTSGIISRNRKYRSVLRQVEKVADTPSTVLIQGETGTGKELLANAIHQLSRRNKQPLVKVNCAAIQENLAESELFGHEKGAFTGAFQRKIGRFELADGGTLFLDEIGELPLNLQPKLLRVLQEGEFERLGSTRTIKVDVRLITATNRDLRKMVFEKTFREDLYFRLSVFPITNLPLRDRKDDIPLLVKFFVDKFNQKMGKQVKEVSAEDMAALMEYDFPGNIRELENIIERAIILSKGEELQLSYFLP